MANSVKIPVELEMRSIESQIGAFRNALKGVKEDTASFKQLNNILKTMEKQFSSLQMESKKAFSTQNEINHFAKGFEKLQASAEVFQEAISRVELKNLNIDLTKYDKAIAKLEQAQNIINNADKVGNAFKGDEQIKGLLDKLKIEINSDTTFKGLSEAFSKQAELIGQEIEKIEEKLQGIKNIDMSEVLDDLNAITERNTKRTGELDKNSAKNANKQIAEHFNINAHSGIKTGSVNEFVNDQVSHISESLGKQNTEINKRISELEKTKNRLQKALNELNKTDKKGDAKYKDNDNLTSDQKEGLGLKVGNRRKVSSIKDYLQTELEKTQSAIDAESKSIQQINEDEIRGYVENIASQIIQTQELVRSTFQKAVKEYFSNRGIKVNDTTMGASETSDDYILRLVEQLEAKNKENENLKKQLEDERASHETTRGQISVATEVISSAEEVKFNSAEVQEAVNGIEGLEQAARREGEAARAAAISSKDCSSAVKGIGADAATASGKIDTASTSLNKLQEAQNGLDQIKNKLKYWFSFQTVARGITKAVKDMGSTIKELDSVMTQIAVVTQMTQEQLWDQMETYSAIAEEYSVSIKGVYEVSQLYYQQGLQTAEVMELTEETLKMAKIANIDYSTATDYMTVAVRGFKLEMSEASRITDVYSALAAGTASDTEELAVAMSKTASSAESVGSSFESTSAMIATMVSVTRESATNIGSAMKSIISRYGEMTTNPASLVDSEGEEMSLNKVDKALKSVGISLQDAQGQFRNFDDVILELAKSWDTIDVNTQRYIATIMAGNRQQSRFLALVGNYEEYAKALELAENAEGAGSQQVLKTMDSLESKLQNVQTAWQQFYTSLGLEDVFKGALDIITQIIDNINNMGKLNAIYTLLTIFKNLGKILTGAFKTLTDKIGGLDTILAKLVKPKKITTDTKAATQQVESIGEKLEENTQATVKLDTSEAMQQITQLKNATENAVRSESSNPEQQAKEHQEKMSSEEFFNRYYKDNSNFIKSGSKLKNDNKKSLAALGVKEEDYDKVSEILKGIYEKYQGESSEEALEEFQEAIQQYVDTTNDAAENIHGLAEAAEGAAESLEEQEENDDDEEQNTSEKFEKVSAVIEKVGAGLQVLGTAIMTYALTLENKSTDDYEKSKVASGWGTIVSGFGESIGTSMAGFRTGGWIGAVIGGLSSLLPAAISGITQLIDGYNYEIIERIEKAKEELSELETVETKAKATSSGYTTALTELKSLAEAQYDSAEAAEAYKAKMNSLGETYPELVSGMDSTGNSIINMVELEQHLAEARYETAKATTESLEKELQIKQLEKQQLEEYKNNVISTNFNFNEEVASDTIGFSTTEDTTFDDFLASDGILSVKARPDMLSNLLYSKVGNFSGIINTLLPSDFTNALSNEKILQFIKEYSDFKKDPDGDIEDFKKEMGFKEDSPYTEDDFENMYSAISELYKNNREYFTVIPSSNESTEVIFQASLDTVGVSTKVFRETFLEEQEKLLKDAELTYADFGLAGEYDDILEFAYKESITKEQGDEFLKFFSETLPAAINNAIGVSEDLVLASSRFLAISNATEYLTQQSTLNPNGPAREIETNYSGLYTTYAGLQLTDAYEKSNEKKEGKTYQQWYEAATEERDAVFEKLDAIGVAGFEGLAKYWDNMNAYSQKAFVEIAKNFGFNEDATEKLYNEAFVSSQKLALDKVSSSQLDLAGKFTSELLGSINANGEISAAATLQGGLFDDVNRVITDAEKFYEQGYTQRGQQLLEDANTYYEKIAALEGDGYANAESILDNLDLTNIEEMISARDALDEINIDGVYNDVINSLDSMIEGASYNVSTLSAMIISDSQTALGNLDTMLTRYSSGMDANEMLEATQQMEKYTSELEEGEEFFEYNAELGKWVYSVAAIREIIEGQLGDLKEDNKKIEGTIQQAESKLKNNYASLYNIYTSDFFTTEQLLTNEWYLSFSEVEQEYILWARSLEENEDKTISAYLEYLHSSLDESNAAIDAVQKELIQGLNGTVNYENVAKGVVSSQDREAIGEMIRVTMGTVSEAMINNAIAALQKGVYSYYQNITGLNLSPELMASIENARINGLSEAINQVLQGAGTIIDATTAQILQNAGLDNLLDKGKGGTYIVKEIEDFSSLISAIVNNAERTISDINNDLVAIYNAANGDKLKTISSMASKTALSYSDLGNLATALNTTVNKLIEETNIFQQDAFTGDFEIINFNAYWEKLGTALTNNTNEYLEAYSAWIDNNLKETQEKQKNTQSELDELLSANVGDQINVAYLQDAFGDELSSYLTNIRDGVATITSSDNIIGLLDYIITTEGAISKIENSIAETQDALLELINGWAEALSSGIAGTLSYTDAETIMSKYGLSNDDFTESLEGLKINESALYKAISQTQGHEREIIIGKVAEALQSEKQEYNDIFSIMRKIEKLNKEISNTNTEIDNARRDELEAELAIAKELEQTLKEVDNTFNFMSRDLPSGFDDPMSAWEGVSDAMNVLNGEDFANGRISFQDYYNMISFMGDDLAATALGFEEDAYTAAELIEKGANAISMVDGEAFVDLSKFGVNFGNGAEGMKEGITKGIQDVAQSQVDMLDAAIGILETAVAMEELAGEDGILDLGDIFSNDGKGTDFNEAWTEGLGTLKEKLEDAGIDTEQIYIEGKTLSDWLTKTTDQLEVSKDQYLEVMQAFFSLTEGDFDPNTSPEKFLASIAKQLKTVEEFSFSDGEGNKYTFRTDNSVLIINDEEGTTSYQSSFGTLHTGLSTENLDETIAKIEEEDFKKAMVGNNNVDIDTLSTLTLNVNGKGIDIAYKYDSKKNLFTAYYNGKTYTGISWNSIQEQIAKDIELENKVSNAGLVSTGQTLTIGGIIYTKYTLPTGGETFVDENGNTLSADEINQKALEEAGFTGDLNAPVEVNLNITGTTGIESILLGQGLTIIKNALAAIAPLDYSSTTAFIDKISSVSSETVSGLEAIKQKLEEITANDWVINVVYNTSGGSDNSSANNNGNSSNGKNSNSGNNGGKTGNVSSTPVNFNVDKLIASFNHLQTMGTLSITKIGKSFSDMEAAGRFAISKIQTALNKIKSPTITVKYPSTVSIGAKATLKVEIKESGATIKEATISETKLASNEKSKAKGNIALAKGNRTLMGELGPELVVSNGRYFTVGNNGAEFVDLADDAIVFNHLQTKRLLSSGSSGRGKPITNERNAVSFATGNANASAQAALDQLKSIRAMWQALLDASSKDLGSKAGSGGGGGGGGGGNNDVAGYEYDLERWYNMLRQIAKLEQQISYEQAKRENMRSGYKYVDSLEKELDLLEKQLAVEKQLASLQYDYYLKRMEDVNKSAYSKIFTYDEQGLMQYVDGKNRGLDALATLQATDSNGVLKMNAKQQLNYITKTLGISTNDLKYKSDGSAAETDADKVQVFFDNVDSLMNELDELYDSYHEHAEKIEDLTSSQNEILQEYIDNQLSLEGKLLQAIEDREQAEIDRLQDEKDALEEATQDYIDGLNDALSKERELYSNNQTDEETARMQRRLAILQRSGGSASEIKSLQDQIDSRLQDAYFQAQQDQIDAIQEASDRQIEKLQTQIDLMTEALEYQKETGLLWNEVYEMMNNWTPEKMLQFVEQYTASYKENSSAQNQQDSEGTLKEAEIWAAKRDKDARENAWNKYYTNANYSDEIKKANESAAKDAFNTGFASGGEIAGAEAADKIFEVANKKNEENSSSSSSSQPIQDTTPEPTYSTGTGKVNTKNTNLNVRSGPSTKYKKIGSLKKGKSVTLTGYKDGWYQIKYGNGTGYVSASYISTSDKNKLPAFAEGGLVDFTGPAWVDGSKKKPEAFLSAEDTALLKSKVFSNGNNSLKTLIAAIEEITKATPNYSSQSNSSIVIENATVNIQPGVISNDYDARRAGEMALEEMVKIARKTTNLVVSR